MADLDFKQRRDLRRLAEDAIHAANRHYGPFVDAVAHPLNIIALLDMADRAPATPSPPVAAPCGDLIAVPRATLISWRQWAAQSMSHAIEHEIAEMCAQPQPQPAQPLTGAPGDMRAKFNEALRLADQVGRSRQQNNYALNKTALNRLVDLEIEIDKFLAGITAPSTPTTPKPEPAFDAMCQAQEELVAKYASMLKTDPVTLLDIAEALYHAEMGGAPAEGTIRRAIRDYHYALDTRQHGGIAQHKAFEAICQVLGMHWVQGQEKAIRDGGAQ